MRVRLICTTQRYLSHPTDPIHPDAKLDRFPSGDSYAYIEADTIGQAVDMVIAHNPGEDWVLSQPPKTGLWVDPCEWVIELYNDYRE